MCSILYKINLTCMFAMVVQSSARMFKFRIYEVTSPVWLIIERQPHRNDLWSRLTFLWAGTESLFTWTMELAINPAQPTVTHKCQGWWRRWSWHWHEPLQHLNYHKPGWAEKHCYDTGLLSLMGRSIFFNGRRVSTWRFLECTTFYK